MPDWLTDAIKTIAITAFTSTVTGIVVHIKNRRKVESRMQETLMKLLRSNIVAIHEVYYNRGYCPMHVKEILQESYSLYESYCEDNMAKQMVEEVMDLPAQRKEEN